MRTTIDESIHRKEAWDKVSGNAKYTDDKPVIGYFHARILTSPHPHARIKSIHCLEARQLKGVKAIITGNDFPVLSGPLLEDRPPIAKDLVRYAGEPVAVVVAVTEAIALRAVRMIEVEYEPLTAVFSPEEALKKEAPYLHPDLGKYKKLQKDIQPVEHSNIASKFQVRKGNIEEGFSESHVVIERNYKLPPSDHLAMEVRAVRAEISADGKVKIETSSQSPYTVVKQLSSCFQIPAGNIEVNVPLVGGAFGGKVPVTLEFLAYMACTKVNGAPVRLTVSREEDMTTAPCRLGLEANIKIGAKSDGTITAADFTFYLDTGAYSDIGPYMSKAIAADCTGPYSIANLSCDSYCIYTNHTYSTSYRGFGHLCYTFCIERTMEDLAEQCGIDSMEFRKINAIRPGHLTPAQVVSTYSNTGNLELCLDKLKNLLHWKGEKVRKINDNKVLATGIACLWKSATPPANAVSGSIITFNSDGSLNLNTGVVEIGSGGQTNLAQMIADKLKMDIKDIHVSLAVNTRLNPEHYKTVASMTNYMAGNAVMKAADDVLGQLKAMGGQIYSCSPEEIEVADSRVFKKEQPDRYTLFKDIVSGYQTPNGASIGEPVIAKGSFMLKGLSMMDPNTGKGRTGPSWTVGAQAVEIEFNPLDFTYKIINAVTVMDVGKVINPDGMKEIIYGGMSMGLSMSSREVYEYNKEGRLNTPNLRTYKLLHIGEEPRYQVEFVETPQTDSPFGSRSISEHGIIGIPAALGNALAAASGIPVRELPLTPERLWRAKEGIHDSK
ncbi:CO/xanthine dehydrogenase Mo-binding subunit [Anaerotaenia torta]|uniref:xanthine dehydrogenase family protein molybdopterin-binding subunit n=1 Tax=Anaerotaenia torta TaxID=433293 RepID=UPI003D1A8C82